MTNPLTVAQRYYAEKINRFGPTPEGVDWNGEVSQELRFATLGRLYADELTFSLNDLGCGYGALFGFLHRQGKDVDYRGYDMVPEMVAQARALYPSASWTVSDRCLSAADFTVASGIFNVRHTVDVRTWTEHVWRTLDHMHEVSRKGFAFNCLTAFSSSGRMRPHLFYGDPGEFLNRCLERYGRSITLLHGAGLYEFTLLCDLRGLPTVAAEPGLRPQGET